MNPLGTVPVPIAGEKAVLPDGWRWVRLGDFVVKIGSGITPLGGHRAYLTFGVPLIRSQNVHMNRFATRGLAYISDEQDIAMESTRVREGDVLLNITGASIGRVCVAPSELLPANVNQHVSIIRLNGMIDPHFLSFYISTPDFQSFISGNQAGATRQALTKVLIENFQIPIPELKEQRRIAAWLMQKMGAVECARTAAEAQLEASAKLASAHLTATFQSSDAKSWPWKPLAECAKLLPSKSVSSAGDEDVTVATTACLTELGFDFSGAKRSKMRSQDVADATLAAGEILIARSNTPDLVGRIALFPGSTDAVCASDLMIRLFLHQPNCSRFFSYYLSSLYSGGYWKERAGGASGSMKKITRTQIMNLRVPVPSPETQAQISLVLSAKFAAVEKLRTSITSANNAIGCLSLALLRRAFQGGL